jgi:ABC-type sugar transport system ATPase subunit
MPSILLQDISNYICREINLSVRNGELLVLAGPTGAGKTTLLNVIAGLVPYEGRVLFDGAPVDALPPSKRRVGYLFQDFLIFPHLKVNENIAFGLRPHGFRRREAKRRVDKLLRLLGIEHLSERYPKSLSGGEKQRVALARALAPRPKILLLDEPFSSLDSPTAKYLRIALRRLQRELEITTLYVTHNQTEAAEMGDRIAVIDQGMIEQTGSPTEVFFEPKNEKVSRLFGSYNILSCKEVRPLDLGLARIEVGGFSLVAPYENYPVHKIAIAPWHIYISRDPPPGPKINRLQGIILDIERRPPIVQVTTALKEARVHVEIKEDRWDELGLQKLDKAFLIFPLRWIRTMRTESQELRESMQERESLLR